MGFIAAFQEESRQETMQKWFTVGDKMVYDMDTL